MKLTSLIQLLVGGLVLFIGANAPAANVPEQSLKKWFDDHYPNLRMTPDGDKIVDPDQKNDTEYTGKEYVHLFFDRYGQSMRAAPPQGDPALQYVVHVLFVVHEGHPGAISYAVKQTKGGVEGRLVFVGGPEDRAAVLLHGAEQEKLKWAEYQLLLRQSNTDIEFNIYSAVTDAQGTTKSTLLQTHEIKMPHVYHGSITAGLLRSNLANPSYELVPLTSDPNQKTVVESGGGHRGFLTAMAVFYWSPVVLVRDAFVDIPKYKRFGRNFSNDHNMFERIFPAIGVGLNDKVFENLLFGITWEPVRGGSLFFGGHYGKVNRFDGPDDFVSGVTPITPEEFSASSGTRWETAFAFGVNLDLLIFKNIFGGNL